MKRTFFVLALVLSLLFVVSCAQQSGGSAESSISEMGDIKRVKVTADQVNVRTGCSNDTPVIETSDKNTTYDVVSKVADWYAVKLPNNQIGFIPSKQCKPIVAEDTKTGGTPTAAGKTPAATPGTTGAAPDANTNANNNANNNTNANANALSSQEQEMLRLVNEARAQNNVQPLQVDMELANVARIKSQDMIDNNYFSHHSPKYGSPFDMMKSFGINYVRAGENIAGNQTVQSAHQALMNSPGHRKNILSADFTHIGIGVKQGGQYGNMFTQMFISKPK